MDHNTISIDYFTLFLLGILYLLLNFNDNNYFIVRIPLLAMLTNKYNVIDSVVLKRGRFEKAEISLQTIQCVHTYVC